MVTIRRVMQPNVSEPVVTVTLKGETPENDRVLFTLVNGHVLSTDKSSSDPDTSVPAETTSVPKQNEPATNNAQTRKKQKKLEKKRQKKLLEAANQINTNQQFISPPQVEDTVLFWVPMFIFLIIDKTFRPTVRTLQCFARLLTR